MKMKKYRILFLILILAGLLSCGMFVSGRTNRIYAADAGTTGTGEAATPTPPPAVKLVSIDYEELWLKVDANGNQKVYFSDKSKKIWYDAVKDKDGYYYIDLSWVGNTKAEVINLKGDVGNEIVSVTLPARNNKIKAKYDKVTGAINFENLTDNMTTFQWRKTTAYNWQDVTIEDAKSSSSAFHEEIEKMRIAGGSIYVRTPPVAGKVDEKGEFYAGVRPSKEVKISIAKRANAPKVTIDGSKLLVNTKDTMEYSTDNGVNWKPAKTKMSIQEIAPAVLTGSRVSILFRTKATDKKPYSKAVEVAILPQRSAPTVSTTAATEVTYESGESKFYLTFNQASKTLPYEYTIVKGTNEPDQNASWKSVTSSKTIAITEKTAPAGSRIYVRKKTIKEGKEIQFQIASKYAPIIVTYKKPTPTPTKAASK